MTLTQTMNANADPEFARLVAATRAENDKKAANDTFLGRATKRFDQATQASQELPMTIQH